MNRNFLVFLLASSVLTPISANSAEIKTPVANLSVEQDWPKSRDAKNAPVVPEEPKAEVKKAEPVKAPEAPVTQKMQPVYDKIPDAGPSATTIFSNKGGGQRVIVTFNKRPKILSTKQEGGRVVIKFGSDFNYNPPAVPGSFAKSFNSVSKQAGNTIVIEHNPELTAQVGNNASMIIVDVKGKEEEKPVEPPKPVEKKPEEKKPEVKPEEKKEDKAAKEKAEKLKKEEADKKAKEEEAKKKSGKAPKVEFSREGDIERLRFNFSKPTAAAVFERFGYYWLVFYTDEQLELPENLKQSQLFGESKKVAAVKADVLDATTYPAPVASPLIFTLELQKPVFAMAEKNENEWLIEVDPSIKYDQENGMSLQTGSDIWLYNTPGLAAKITVKDENTNDTIDVYPLSGDAYVKEKASTAKFSAEKTVQGIVLKPIGQYELRQDEKDRLKIVKPSAAPVATNTPEGEAPAEPVTPANAKPIFPFEKWPQFKSTDYRKTEQKMQGGDHFEFGKFLFSQGLYAEAAVNLQGVPGMQASFLTAASFYMTGRYEEALRLFDGISLPSNVDANELLMWQAAANYELYKVSPSTTKPVDLNNFGLPKNLDNYPEVVKSELLFSVAEKTIEDGKFDTAQNYINILSKSPLDVAHQNYLKYLQGRVYDGQGKKARAYETWGEVAKAKQDRESQAKSSFQMIAQDYATNKITPDETVKRLNDIRIMWRGDIFEYNLLNLLAEAYAKTGNELDALRTYKEILGSFPRFPNNLAIAAKMRELYLQALKKDFQNKDKTFRAVTIYYEFEELRPSGEDGNNITLQLADSLAQYDLLDDSAKILKKYSEGLSDLVQKAEIGTRIAILYYLNNKPKDALDALKDSESPGLPNYLVQERKILQIRSMIDTGQLDLALASMSSLPDEQMNRFRTDIFWKQKKWPELLSVYELLPTKNDEDIMRMAVANVMLGDKAALQKLGRDNSARMEKSPFAESFSFVTDTENVDYRNLDASLNLDKTQELLQKYKQRLKDKGLASVTGAPAATPAAAGTPVATPATTPAAAPQEPAKAAPKEAQKETN